MRNMFIIAGLVVLGWPRMKVKRNTFQLQPTLWVFPSTKTWGIVLYLGVIRSIVIEILEKSGRSLEKRLPLLRSHIFVDGTRPLASEGKKPNRVHRKSLGVVWSGSDINSSIRSFSPDGCPMDDKLLRQLFATLTARHLPQLTNLQMGHLAPRYRSINQTAFNLSHTRMDGFFSISQVWQAFWDVIPLPSVWDEQFFQRPSGLAIENLAYAAHRAETLVFTEYLIANQDSWDQQVHRIIQDLSFLEDEQVRDLFVAYNSGLSSLSIRQDLIPQ